MEPLSVSAKVPEYWLCRAKLQVYINPHEKLSIITTSLWDICKENVGNMKFVYLTLQVDAKMSDIAK